MQLIINDNAIPFIVEETAYEGVRQIAGKVTQDVEKVSGARPDIIALPQEGSRRIVLCATLGRSPLLDSLIKEGRINVDAIAGKWEVYLTKLVKEPFEGVEEALVICGSDKRGTIYGMFALSEYIGVSPLCFWGDVEPLKRKTIEVGKNFETVSKEPSVKYRGFFINDEWPCFGRWASERFGGINAEAYDCVFEFLLRLKGNYLWPAMWTSCFPLDGPGSLNEELADLYGVVIGFSHHEPCLRAGGEYDKVKGEGSVYGNAWNFYTNREGITRFWADGLKRSGKYENMITMGIRGEWDSAMLGDEASLKQNIDLLKDVITVQKELIKEYVNENVAEVPQLLALYKEVEPFFYGDADTQGLKDWEGLNHITCMLCEDNYGFMRSLPTPELLAQMKAKDCGFGMYYHLDYHGAPVSYEWLPSTPLSKVWEQMCMAYDYGVRDVWIVNVGDLKGNEVALQYFLTLAYDYDTWGSSAPNSWKEYLTRWFDKTFPEVEPQVKVQMKQVLVRFMAMNGRRRPEALNAEVFHPCHYLEADRMLKQAAWLEQENEAVYAKLSKAGREAEKEAYYSMIYYPAKASVNLLKMQLYAGKNAHYAKQGRCIANDFADKIAQCIAEDRRIAEEFAAFKNGKWKGMELEAHIGFTSWNEDDCRYPLRILVEPYGEPRLSVSRKDSEQAFTRVFGGARKITVDDFLYEGNEVVVLELANSGVGEVNYEITGSAPWLNVTPCKGSIKTMQEVRLVCDRERLPLEAQMVRLTIRSSQSALIVENKADVEVEVWANRVSPRNGSDTFLQNRGVIAIEADHFCRRNDTAKGSFVKLEDYGRSGQGMKVFPVTARFAEGEELPSLTYRFLAWEPGEYQVEVWTTPTNPVQSGEAMCFMLETAGSSQIVEAVPKDFVAGDWRDSKWSKGVVNQIRVVRTGVVFSEGVQELTIGALEPGLVLERILIYRTGQEPKPSYMGPKESGSI